MIQSLCAMCSHRKEIVSGKGSRFLLCEKSATDRRFQKYPPQPIIRCDGYEKSDEDQDRFVRRTTGTTSEAIKSASTEPGRAEGS